MRTSRVEASVVRCCVSLLVMLLLAGGIFAQSTTDGAVGGTVVDPSGAAVPNATVTVKNNGTNAEQIIMTDESGYYRATKLTPAIYTVTIAAAGFADLKAENVIVQVGSLTELSPHLSVASAGTTVLVSSELPQVNTSQQDFASNVNQVAISELPVNGRRWSTFALLTPGVVPDGTFGLLSFRGISGLLNNNTVDGGDNNQAFFAEEKGRTRLSYSVSQASIQEFQVNTSNFSAEYGRAAGGVVNAVTKSGTNAFHGEGFYFIRDGIFAATNPFTTKPELVNGSFQQVKFKPDDRRHQFGGVLGGPIVKDRLFFLFSYDGQRRNFPGDAVPSPASAFNPITVSNPALASSAAVCPTTANPNPSQRALTAGETLFCRGVTQAQTNSNLAFLSGLTGLVPRTGNQDIFFPKVDWHITQNHTLSVSYNHLKWDSPAGIQTQATNNLGIASFGNDFVRAESLIAHLYSTIGSRITNEARFQYGRDNEFENAQAPAPGEPATGPNGSVPDVVISNGIEFGKPTFLNRKAFPDERRLQWADTISATFGHHLFKFGFDLNRVHDIEDNLRIESGSYSYSSLSDFITDNSVTNGCIVKRGSTNLFAPCFSQFQQAFGPTLFVFNTWDYAGFFQDDWRILPHFTLNLGLRYEYEKLPGPQLPNSAVPQTSKFPSDTNNWGPRFGFAWDINGDGKTALRGGYGIYYGRLINSTIANAITNTGAAGAQFTFTIRPTDLTFADPQYPATLPSAAGTQAKTSLQFFDPDFQNPLIQEVDLTLERQLGFNTAISLSYLSSRGQELPAFIDRNLSPATSSITYTYQGGPLNAQKVTLPLYGGARPNVRFNSLTDITSIIRSNYNAFAVQLNRQFKQGLQFSANYTFSHAIDNGQTSQTFTANNSPFDPANIQLDKGNTAFNIPHRFVASAIWTPLLSADTNSALRALVNGFSLSPIATVSSGYQYNATVSGSPGVTTQGGGLIGAGGSNRFPFVPRNGFTMPSLINFDLRLARDIKVIKEAYRLQILAEAFNLFNHQEISGVNTTLYRISGTNLNFQAPFGTTTAAQSSLYRERQIQLGLRFTF